MARGYSKGRGGFVGTLVSQRFIDRDPASITRGGATIQAASSVDETVSTFTSSGTVTLACATTVIEYLIVAGGGGSCCSSSQQHPGSGGGGGGGFLTKACYPVTGGTDLTITVGAGGSAAGGTCGGRGGDSSIAGPGICDVVATGGGFGHRLANGGPGGSAGGGYNPGTTGNVGNTPPAPSAKGGPQGNNSAGRGGGGACTGTDGIGGAYQPAPASPAAPEGTGPNAPAYEEVGDGGKGRASPLTGTVLYAGGGGGGGYQNTPCGSPGRGGSGGAFNNCYTQPACGPGGGRGGAYHGTIAAQAGAANKGGGAGGAGGSGFLTGQGFSGAAGGSGFVKIKQPAICVAASASGIFDLTDQLEARVADTWPNS